MPGRLTHGALRPEPEHTHPGWEFLAGGLATLLATYLRGVDVRTGVSVDGLAPHDGRVQLQRAALQVGPGNLMPAIEVLEELSGEIDAAHTPRALHELTLIVSDQVQTVGAK